MKRTLSRITALAFAGALAAPVAAQSSAPVDQSVLFVESHIVRNKAGFSPRALFTEAQIPDAQLNATDRCIDQEIANAAVEFANKMMAVGPMARMGGFSYIVDAAELAATKRACEISHGQPARALSQPDVTIAINAQVLPEAEALKRQRPSFN